jgi:hypothetical protein
MESPARELRRHREDLGILPVVESKQCVKCWTTKDREDFPASSVVSDGLSSWCRSCHALANREWRARQKEAQNG